MPTFMLKLSDYSLGKKLMLFFRLSFKWHIYTFHASMEGIFKQARERERVKKRPSREKEFQLKVN